MLKSKNGRRAGLLPGYWLGQRSTRPCALCVLTHYAMKYLADVAMIVSLFSAMILLHAIQYRPQTKLQKTHCISRAAVIVVSSTQMALLTSRISQHVPHTSHCPRSPQSL